MGGSRAAASAARKDRMTPQVAPTPYVWGHLLPCPLWRRLPHAAHLVCAAHPVELGAAPGPLQEAVAKRCGLAVPPGRARLGRCQAFVHRAVQHGGSIHEGKSLDCFEVGDAYFKRAARPNCGYEVARVSDRHVA